MTTHSNKSLMQSYNYDLIDSICHHCDIKELLAMNLVSSQVKQLVNPRIYQSITISSRDQLVLLQHLLVDRPQLRRLIRRVTLHKRVISLCVRGSTQPSGNARGYVYGDIDIVQCLSILLLPLPNLSHLEIEVYLPNLVLADSNIIQVFHRVLRRSSSNTVFISKRPLRISNPGVSSSSVSDCGDNNANHEGVTLTLHDLASRGAARNIVIPASNEIDTELHERFDEHFPLPFDDMELHPAYDPSFPVLHWLGLGPCLGRSAEVLYRMTYEVKHSPPLKLLGCLRVVLSHIASGIGYVLSKLL